MTDWVVLTNFAVSIVGFVISGIGIFIALIAGFDEKRQKNFFVHFFIIIALYAISTFVTNISTDFLGEGYVTLSKIGLFCESLFSSMLMPSVLLYILARAGVNWRKRPSLYIAATLWVIYFVLLIITQFTDEIYYFTPDNVYHRGELYPILLVPPVLLMLSNILALFFVKNRLSKRLRNAFLVFLVIPLACMVIQMALYGVLLIVLGTTVSALLMLLLVIRDQVDKMMSQANENLRLNSKIAVLQMRPHFIYNTMTSIYCMIEKEPKKAQQVTLDFTSYLRQNFTAIVKEEPIPFKEELEHTRAYLAVEQTRFEDDLIVEFDTPHIAFRLPPLTLQPIVENSVKYGVNPELDPLVIKVITRKTENGSEVIVEDTGAGFGKEDNNEPHTALKNIRERLDIMCNGTLKISPRENGGTVVTIFIPKD